MQGKNGISLDPINYFNGLLAWTSKPKPIDVSRKAAKDAKEI